MDNVGDFLRVQMALGSRRPVAVKRRNGIGHGLA
jgi:hypothetical protein